MILVPEGLGKIVDAIKLPDSENGILRGNIIIFSMTKATTYAEDEFMGLTRNSGFSWEPGRYACMLIVAIFFNMARTGFNLKRNKGLWILLAGLLTTQSTTGFISLLIILIHLLFNKNIKYALAYLVLLIPLSIAIYNLPFVGEKINKLIDTDSTMEKVDQDLEIDEDRNYVPQRFDGLAFEFLNILNDPIFGYGNDVENSYVKNNISAALVLSNGVLKVLARFGLIVGAIFYLLLYKSSRLISKFYGIKGGIFFMLLYISISISYDFILVPFFLAATLICQFVTIGSSVNENYQMQF
jgi:hypothetical protein